MVGVLTAWGTCLGMVWVFTLMGHMSRDGGGTHCMEHMFRDGGGTHCHVTHV